MECEKKNNLIAWENNCIVNRKMTSMCEQMSTYGGNYVNKISIQ